MKKLILCIFALLCLVPSAIKPMSASDACEITWHLSQIAAGSTATIAVFNILKDCYNNRTKPQQVPLKHQPTALRLISLKNLPKRPSYNKKKKGPNNISSPSASSSSPSQNQEFMQDLEPILVTTGRESRPPQQNLHEKLKNLPSRCAQAITKDTLIQSCITLAVAIAAYTTTRAGVEGIAEYFV